MESKRLTKLLIVDDDEDILIITKYALAKMEGVEIHYETSGTQVLEEVLRFKPDLIVLDVMMPHLDGIAVLKILQQNQETSHIPVIFFTAKVQKEEVESYRLLGILDLIFKPFDPLNLGNLIQTIWQKQFLSK